MYKLDLGLVSVIATIAAVAIGVYSSIHEKKKARRRALEQKMELGETEEQVIYQEPSEKIFNNPFEELFRAFKEGEQPRPDSFVKEEEDEEDMFSFARKEYKPAIQKEQLSVPPPVVAAAREYVSISTDTVVDKWTYDNGMDSIENTGISLMDGVQIGSAEDAFKEVVPKVDTAENSLKVRIKRSPKDVILFAEVLSPAYQKF